MSQCVCVRGAIDLEAYVSHRDDSLNMFLSLRVRNVDKDNVSQTGAGQRTHKGGKVKGQLLSLVSML